MKFTDVANNLKNLKVRNFRRVWQPFMEKYQCDYVCEIGVYKGDNFMELVAHSPKQAVAIDSWKDDNVTSRNDAHYSQEELDLQYEYFSRRVEGMPFVKVMRDYSFNAVKEFDDNYFDFVYIDADHSVSGCYTDLINWYPKVKPGKFLAGHDYRRGFGVVEAVNRFTKDNNLEIIFLSPSIWVVIKKEI